MPLESRSRMISFRLTDDEYERFRRLCLARGLGNISQLIRGALNQLIADAGDDLPAAPPPPPEMHHRVATLESRLADLATTVARLELRLTEDLHLPATPVPYAQSANGQ